jgi:cytochrome o ubiquinol oxidase subunit IV
MTDAQHAAHSSEPDFGTGKKTLKMYIVGVALCILLTLLPFGVVMKGSMSRHATFALIILAALAQFFVQVICFLRLTTKTAQGKTNIVSFLFSFLVVFVLIIGSLWIMWHLNYNMMH